MDRSRHPHHSIQKKKQSHQPDLPQQLEQPPTNPDGPTIPVNLPFGLTKIKHGTAKNVSATKIQSFTLGINRKSDLEKEKERLAKKEREDQKKLAEVYKEFVSTFEDNDDDGYSGTTSRSSDSTRRFQQQVWVKSSTMVPSSSYDREEGRSGSTVSSSASSNKTIYKPQMKFVKSGDSSANSNGLQRKNVFGGDDDDEADNGTNVAPKETRDAPSTAGTKKRQLDTFLEELKKGQEAREQRIKSKRSKYGSNESSSSITLQAAFEEYQGSHDIGNPSTTNLYVGNLSPSLDEVALCREFAVYGPIASVKIMWPRTQEEIDRKRNCGFISFMERADAEVAAKEMDGKRVAGYIMQVGWGKAVPIPPQPIFVLNPEESGRTDNSKHASGRENEKRSNDDILVTIPSDPETLSLIHQTIEYVILNGPSFEVALVERERENEQYRFLTDHNLAEHRYYRWKLYSMLQGDSKHAWRLEPFRMYENGPIWIPPEIPLDALNDESDSVYETESESESEGYSDDNDADHPDRPSIRRKRLPKGILPDPLNRKLRYLLRTLDPSRSKIGRAMVFAIQHSDAAEQISQTILESLLIPTTHPFTTKLARLYLVSDILHNSSAAIPNAWRYRDHFRNGLVDVYLHFGMVRNRIRGRLRAEQFRKLVLTVVNVWEGWLVFDPDFCESLRMAFVEGGKVNESSTGGSSNNNSSSNLPSEPSTQENSGNTTNNSANEGEGEDDIDGVPISIPPRQPPPTSASKFKPITFSFSSKFKPIDEISNNDQDVDVDDDIDGVPLQLPIKPKEMAKPITIDDYDDDDIDGVPLQIPLKR